MITIHSKKFDTKEEATKYLHAVIRRNPIMRLYYWSDRMEAKYGR